MLATAALYTRQPLLVAYIAVGCILGPHGFKMVSDAELLSEIESEHFARAVNNYWEKWGFAPHPATALAGSRLLSAAP